MIYLIHGSGLLGISLKISELRDKFSDATVSIISGKSLSFREVLLDLKTSQLFSEKRLVVLEDFSDLEIEQLPIDESLVVILKYSKTLPKTSNLLKAAQDKKIQTFVFTEAGETVIFPFLDQLADKNKNAFKYLEEHFEEHGGQYILTMIFYLFRRLAMSSKKVPGFLVQRQEKQKKNFDIERIRELYKFGLEGDFKVKSGLMDERMGLTLLVSEIVT